MAIYAHRLAQEGSGTDAASYTFSSNDSGDVTNGTLILALVENSHASAPATPTLTGWGLTWVQVATQLDNPGTARGTLFRAMGTPSANAGLVVGFAGATQTGCGIEVDEVFGTDISGTNGSGAIVQSASANGSSTTPAVTLSAFASGQNGTYLGTRFTSGTTHTPGSGYTALGYMNHANPGSRIFSEWRVDGDTAPSCTLASGDWVAIAVEIASGPGLMPPPFLLVDQYQSTAAAANDSQTFDWSPQAGDLILATFAANGALSTIGTPTGYTARATIDDTGSATSLGHYERISDGTETSITFVNTAIRHDYIICIFRSPYGVPAAGAEFDTSVATDFGSVTSLAPGSITPADVGELFFAVASCETGNISGYAVNAGFMLVPNLLSAPTLRLVVGYKSKSLTDKAAENPTLSWTTARNACGLMACYKFPLYPPKPPIVAPSGAVMRAANW